jgi:hypothetical protein
MDDFRQFSVTFNDLRESVRINPKPPRLQTDTGMSVS